MWMSFWSIFLSIDSFVYSLVNIHCLDYFKCISLEVKECQILDFGLFFQYCVGYFVFLYKLSYKVLVYMK